MGKNQRINARQIGAADLARDLPELADGEGGVEGSRMDEKNVAGSRLAHDDEWNAER